MVCPFSVFSYDRLPFAGFRSRIKYYSVLDPTKLCSYISEVLDAGLLGPLFKVCFPLYHRKGNNSVIYYAEGLSIKHNYILYLVLFLILFSCVIFRLV